MLLGGALTPLVSASPSSTSTPHLVFVEVHMDGQSGVDGLFRAWSVAISPDGKHVYVAGQSDDAVAVFSRNSTTGALSFLEVHKDGAGGVDGLNGAVSVTVSPDGKHVYVAAEQDSAVAVFSRDSTTGALTFVEVQKNGVGGVDGLLSAQAVTVSPDGSHIYIVSSSEAVAVFGRNSTTGALSFLEVHQGRCWGRSRARRRHLGDNKP